MKLFPYILICLVFCYTNLLAQNFATKKYSVYFQSGKKELNPAAKKIVQNLADSLLLQHNYSLVLQGNTDNIGSNTANDLLSKARCESVKQYLESQAIAVTCFRDVEGFGEEMPIVDNLSEKQRQKNRRVDIFVNSLALPLSVLSQKEENTSTPLTESALFNAPKSSEAQVAANPIPVLSKEEKEKQSRDWLATLGKPETQSFTIRPEMPNVLTLKSGTALLIEANSFILQKDKEVIIRITEYMKKSEMIMASLYTLSGGKLLETGGMYLIEAEVEGKKVALQTGKTFTLTVPRGNKYKPQMQAFQAVTYYNDIIHADENFPNRRNPYSTIDWQITNTTNAASGSGNLTLCQAGTPPNAPNNVVTEMKDYCSICDSEGVEPSNPQKTTGILSRIFHPARYNVQVRRYRVAKKEWKEKQAQSKVIFNKYKVNSCRSFAARIDKSLSNIEGYLEWAATQQQFAYLSSYNMPTQNAYLLEGVTLGWTNCDRYLGVPQQALITLNWKEKIPTDAMTFMVVKGDNVIVPSYSQIPKNKDITVILIRKEEEEIRLGVLETKANAELKSFKMKTVSEEELKTYLAKLDS